MQKYSHRVVFAACWAFAGGTTNRLDAPPTAHPTRNTISIPTPRNLPMRSTSSADGLPASGSGEKRIQSTAGRRHEPTGSGFDGRRWDAGAGHGIMKYWRAPPYGSTSE